MAPTAPLQATASAIPPDYGFSSPNCNEYAGGAQDPLGTLVNPNERNFMGYFNGCNYEFSPQQQSTIKADLNASDRNYLDNTFAPAAESFVTPSTLLVAPASNAETPFYDAVSLEWNTVPGATHYLLEVDLTTLFSSNFSQFFVLTTNTFQLGSLQPGRTYYWRVRPFNQYYTCAQARQRSFRTPQTSSAKDLSLVQSAVIRPNPGVSGAPAQLTVRQSEAEVQITDAAGRLVRSLGMVAFSGGETTLDLPADEVKSGLYFVKIQHTSGIAIRKWIVL
jgi:hypothetical protein